MMNSHNPKFSPSGQNDSKTERGTNHKDTVMKIYDIVNRKLDNLDTVSIRIKAWAVALWGVIMAQGLSSPVAPLATVGLMALMLALLWLMDMHYKLFHEQFLGISRDIELMIQQPSIDDHQLRKVLIKDRVTGRIMSSGVLRPEVKAALEKYWFHLPYIVLLIGTAAVSTIRHFQTSP